jgi:hydrogenase expression/formation protein HypD
MSKIKLMEVCGTHTMVIARSGIKKVLPQNIELISGPGCPVCVTPQVEIDKLIKIAGMKDNIVVTFGDMMRVPGSKTSLVGMRKKGAVIKVVYSPLDALTIANENPNKKVVFMGIGFETTSPTVAATILEAKKKKLENFFVLSNFKLIFPALEALVCSHKVQIDGFICPGHVSVITGTAPYEQFVKRYKKPCVITGFEDIDVMKGIKRLFELITNREYKVEVEYRRAVKKQGNIIARRLIEKVFTVKDSEWRGLGLIKKSGLKIKKEYRNFDAEKKFGIEISKTVEPKGCLCGEVLQGIKRPCDCRLFRKRCTPQSPIGPCMVSSEGTCAAFYKYG